MEQPPLTATGRAILGMVALGRSTGYEIKQLADRSIRHFWAVSYGQVYPELRRLEAQGLVRRRPEQPGGRARKAYGLTEAGRRALKRWLAEDREHPFEVRSEGMLKLFFSHLEDRAATLRQLRALRRSHERLLAQLTGITIHDPSTSLGLALTLELGIEIHARVIAWCQEAERRLAATAESADPRPDGG